MIWTYIIIFLLAAAPFFEATVIAPIAIIGGIPVVPVIIISILGNLSTIILLIVFIDFFRDWYKNKKANKENPSSKSNKKRSKRAQEIWEKYGLPGLAFIGTILLGSHLTALLALSFGGTRSNTLLLMVVSIAFWVITLGIATHFGFDFLVKDEDSFITNLFNR